MEKNMGFAIRHGLFASMDSVDEAMKYAYELIETIPADGGSRVAAYTAFHVMLNTIADQIEENNK